MFLTVLAFAMQSFVVQTHIHVGTHDRSGIVKLANTAVPAQGKTTPGDSKDTCPLCQAIAHAGAVLAPDAPLLFVPVWVFFETRFLVTGATTRANAHSWQSRAPPQR